MTKPIIITGAAGYIGGHTALELKRHGHTVIGIDRAVTIPAAVEFLDEFICMDFADVTDYCAQLRHVDTIIHCAGTNLVEPSVTDPGEYYNNNVAKTNRMLDWLGRKKWPGTVIFSSSAAIYGNARSPIAESAVYSARPQSPYGWSKLMVEQILHDHCQAHGLKGISLRYFNAAGADPQSQMGPAQNGTHLINRVIEAVCKNTMSEFVINGADYDTRDGTCMRDFIHVTDVALAHLAAIKFSEHMPKAQHRCYNIGTGTAFTVKEVLQAVTNFAGVTFQAKLGTRRSGDTDRLFADPTRFIYDTNWKPQHSDLAEIARTTYAWMKKTYYNH